MNLKEQNKIYHKMLLKKFYITFPLVLIAIVGLLLEAWGKEIQKPFDKIQRKMFDKIETWKKEKTC